jgi:tRNA-specific 2-thiouridylase
MRILVAMSGGVDSSVTAGVLAEAGHEVVGATLKLWGGESDSGCCSVADTEDARKVANQLGIDHYVFNMAEEFAEGVIEPYVRGHAACLTPNPCVECNRRIKFERLLERALRLGFDALATGHYARVTCSDGLYRLWRSVDRTKDQSYVLSMLGQGQLAHVIFPLGALTKAEVRRIASEMGLWTAAKRDSMGTCFVARREGRLGFLARRIPLHQARVVDVETGAELGVTEAVELVTVGQRRGLGVSSPHGRRFVVGIDPKRGVVEVGPPERLLVSRIPLERVTWVTGEPAWGEALQFQVSAHGEAVPGRLLQGENPRRGWAVLDVARRKVAPGQTVAFYSGDEVIGSAIASRSAE